MKLRNLTFCSFMVFCLCLVTGVLHAQVMPDELPGIEGGDGFVGVTDYFPGLTVTEPALDVSLLLEDILNGDVDVDEFSGEFPVADLTDPATNATGGGAISSAPFEYPGGGGDDFVTVFKGAFRVAEPGLYTFQAQTDDGFAFRVHDGEFTDVAGNGAIDLDDPSTLVHSANTGNSNTRGLIDLSAGVHTFDAFVWERGGGAYAEFSTAKGDFLAGGAGWLALGDDSVVPDRTVGPIALLTEPMFVGNVNDIFDLDLELARETLLDGDFDDAGTAETFHLDDDRTALGCPFNEFPDFHDPDTTEQFPNSSAGNLDNFASLMSGSFVLDDGDNEAGETMDVSVHMDSDDRGLFRIVDQDFTAVTGDEILDIEGDDSIFANRDTCNTNVTGVITLTEGVEYEFEAVHVENGGDAGMQILMGAGNALDGDVIDYFVLTTEGEPILIPGNTGLGFVDPETTGILCDFDGSGALDTGDIDAMLAEVRAGTNDAQFDLTADGIVNQDDINALVEGADKFNTYIGDANLDGEFNSSDFVFLFTAGEYEDGVAENSTWATGDFNGDAEFNSGDFVVAFSRGGYEKGPRAAVAAVPEPSASVLAILAGVGCVMLRRKK